MREIVITAADANRRLDKFLGQYLNDAPRTLLYKWLRKKYVKLNGKKAEGYEITAEGDRLNLYLADETIDKFMSARKTPVSLPMPDIVYEDEQLLILNKPAGLLTHGDSTGGESDTLLGRVLYYLKKRGIYDNSRYATFTPALCNRLDRNTSGLVACGKTLAAVQRLNALFAGRDAEKTYLAVVHGKLSGKAVTLEGFSYKDKHTNTVRISPECGYPDALAVKTVYDVMAVGAAHSLLRVKPVTGRSHQIRAQLAAAGHPLAGDVKYGGKITSYMPGQLLHCRQLTFTAALNAPVRSFEAEAPAGFAACMKDWFCL